MQLAPIGWLTTPVRKVTSLYSVSTGLPELITQSALALGAVQPILLVIRLGWASTQSCSVLYVRWFRVRGPWKVDSCLDSFQPVMMVGADSTWSWSAKSLSGRHAGNTSFLYMIMSRSSITARSFSGAPLTWRGWKWVFLTFSVCSDGSVEVLRLPVEEQDKMNVSLWELHQLIWAVSFWIKKALSIYFLCFNWEKNA